MDNKVSITVDEFANAIIASRLPKKSMRVFFEALTAPGRKEKHAGWTRICEHIRQARNMSMTNKGWRKEAHTLFMENLVEIEQLVWDKILNMPVATNNIIDVCAAVNSAVNSLSDDEKPTIIETEI